MSNFLQVCFLLFESIAQVTYVFIGVKLEKQKQDHLRTCHQAIAMVSIWLFVRIKAHKC